MKNLGVPLNWRVTDRAESMFSISNSGRHWRGSCARGRALGWVALLRAVLSPAGEQPLAVLYQIHLWMSLLPSPLGQLSPAAGPLLPGSA